MPFIPCSTATTAVVVTTTETERIVEQMPVEAWDDLGSPYVAGATGLVRADSVPGFVRLNARTVREVRQRLERQPTEADVPPRVRGG